MGEAFAWLGEIVGWVGRWIPRLNIIDTTQGYVKFVGGKRLVSGGAGLVFHWPLITKILIMSVVRDSLNCKSQTITLPSGDTVLVEAIVIFEVRDIERLAAHTADSFATIADLTAGAVLTVIEGIASWDELQKMSTRQPRARDSELNYRLKEEVQRALDTYGVTTLAVFLQNKAKTRVIRLVQD